ncbi:hypothetical protein D3C80_964590 [compost metagenome]
MEAYGSAILGAAGHGDLELARQVGELWVVGGPLAQDLGMHPWIDHFIGGGAGKMVGGHVANAVAAGLDAMQVGIGQHREDLGRVGEMRPIELDVLASGEVAVAFIVGAGHIGQLAQLHGAERAIGNGHAQHVAMQLQVQAIHQSIDLERFFIELATQPAGNLLFELARTVLEKTALEWVVLVNPGLAGRHRHHRTLPGLSAHLVGLRRLHAQVGPYRGATCP